VRRNPSTPGLIGGGFLGALVGVLAQMLMEPAIPPAGYDQQKQMAMYALGGAALGAAAGYSVLK